MRVSGFWTDIVSVPPGRFRLVTGGAYDVLVYDEDGTLLRTIPTPEGMWHMRAAGYPDGTIGCIGQGQQGGGTQLLLIRPDGTHLHMVRQEPFFWAQSIIRDAVGGFACAIQVGPNQWQEAFLGLDGAWSFGPSQSVPVWPGGDGTTSQGFSQYDASGAPVWSDAVRFREINGVPIICGQVEHGLFAGQDPVRLGMNVVVGPVKGRAFTQDHCYEPRVCFDGARWAIGSRTQNGAVFQVVHEPFTMLEPWEPATPPPPVDPPPVEPPPVSTPNHLPTVESVRAQYPTNEELGVERAFRVTNEVAWIHRDEGFGLRKKPIGQNYLGYAIDIAFHKPSNQFVDVLFSSETIGGPQWSEVPGAVAEEWAPPLDPATLEPAPPEPPEPPTPTEPLEQRVAALEREIFRLKEAMAGWIVHE